MSAVQHMVLLKFKEETGDDKIVEIFNQLEELTRLIGGITYFAGGPYSSHEGLNQGYSHGFIMTFESAAARDTYLPHPEHERVKQAILPCIEGVVAFDFEVTQ